MQKVVKLKLQQMVSKTFISSFLIIKLASLTTTIIYLGIHVEETDMLTTEEEQFTTSACSLRPTGVPELKLSKFESEKIKRTRQTTTSKMIFKAETSDYDENIDINDDYEYDQTGSESQDFYECQLCSTQFTDREVLLVHLKEHDSTSIQCDGCNRIFDDEEQLLQHDCESNDIMNDVVNDEDLICIPCNKKMKSTAQLRQHSKMHDSMSLIITYLEFFPCHDCCLLFLSKERLSKHNEHSHPLKNTKPLAGLSEKIDESCTDYQFLDEEKQADFKEGEIYACGECSQSFQVKHYITIKYSL